VIACSGDGAPRYRERQNLISIASITLSIGAANVGVYIVFFKFNRTNLWQIIAIELVLLALWCATASWFGRQQVILRLVNRMGHMVAPLVFIGLSLYILVRRPPSVAAATAQGKVFTSRLVL
jgi:cadmium resistance protein CadD (predicted permease)